MHDKKEITHTLKHRELTKGEKSNNNWTFASVYLLKLTLPKTKIYK